MSHPGEEDLSGRFWEERYREGNTGWDLGQAFPGIAAVPPWIPPGPGLVLVPGCGLGHDADWLAGQGFQVEGVDISTTAIARAREVHGGGNPGFRVGDVTSSTFLRPGDYRFVFEHTCLCALHPSRWEPYVANLRAALRPGGRVFAVLFTGLENDDPPPFPIPGGEVLRLFAGWQRLAGPEAPLASVERRKGRETTWVFEKPSGRP